MHLTRREFDAMRFLRSRLGCPPSLGELANHLHVSQRRAAQLLKALAAKGVVSRENGKHRAIAICQ